MVFLWDLLFFTHLLAYLLDDWQLREECAPDSGQNVELFKKYQPRVKYLVSHLEKLWGSEGIQYKMRPWSDAGAWIKQIRGNYQESAIKVNWQSAGSILESGGKSV